MKHGMIILPMEQSRDFVEILGTKTLVQFEDMNAKSMRRPYKKHIQRIDEMERMIRFLLDEVASQQDVKVISDKGDDFLMQDPYKLDAVEAELKKLTDIHTQFKQNHADLIQQHNAVVQEQCVMQMRSESLSRYVRAQASAIVGNSPRDDFDFTSAQSLLREEGEFPRAFDVMFNSMTGVLLRADQQSFARILFRATRGNLWTHFVEIPQMLKDPKTGQLVHKTAFAIYFLDSRSGPQTAMSHKVNKICQAFQADLYEPPGNRDAAERRYSWLKQAVSEKEKALGAYEQFVKNEAKCLTKLRRQGGNSTIEEWRLFCQREFDH
jgi:V-type H+-transporting ATPase subunit a